MYTNLTPCYEFKDGAGFVVDEWRHVTEGDKIRVYVPSMMSEIDRGMEAKESIESVVSPHQLFLNTTNSPNIPTIVTTLNYISVEVGYEMVMNKANKELNDKYAKDPNNAQAITHIPMNSKLLPGDQVTIASDIGSIRDLYIY